MPGQRGAAIGARLAAAGRSIEAAPRAIVLAAALGCFTAAHLVYRRLGITLNAGTLEGAWQILDLDLLRRDLLRSLAYLHCQPPAYNALVGVVLKLSPTRHLEAFQALQTGFALALYLSLIALGRGLGVRRALALPIATAFLVSPAFVLYEHWLFYTLPVAALLCLAALSLHRFLRTGRALAAAGFAAALFLVCATWSAFHLIFYVGAAGAAYLLARPGQRRTLSPVALVPGALLFGLYLKNFILFGTFAVNSWMGMSLAKVALPFVPQAELRALAKHGRVSPVAQVPPYGGLSSYPHVYRDAGRWKGIPALSAPTKRDGVNSNYNHVGFIGISKQYLADVRVAVAARPRALRDGVSAALALYAQPADHYVHLDSNRRKIARYAAYVDERWLARAPADYHLGPQRRPVYLTLVAGMPILFLLGLRWARRARDRAEKGALLFALGTIAYATVVFNVLELGENNRFRFSLEPLFVVLFAMLCERALTAMMRWLRRASSR